MYTNPLPLKPFNHTYANPLPLLPFNHTYTNPLPLLPFNHTYTNPLPLLPFNHTYANPLPLLQFMIFICFWMVTFNVAMTHSYNWHIPVKDGITPNWACSDQLVTSLKTRHNGELRWDCVVFQWDETCTNHKYTSNIFTVLYLILIHLWNKDRYKIYGPQVETKLLLISNTIYTPVHLVESVENYALCMRRCLLCSSNVSIRHSALAFTRANRTDASAKH